MNKIVIVGATSGIGYEVAKGYLKRGWTVGIAGRRQERLEEIQASDPEKIKIQALDVTSDDAPEKLQLLIEKMGGMDLFLLSSGIGNQNPDLNPEIEIRTARTNVEGFIRMTTAAFRYFEKQGSGHLSVISSIAGTKGLGSAPSYSATKRFQNTYMEALEQLSNMKRLGIRFTDIRPGFVATDLLKDGNYPMLMTAEKVAGHIIHALDKKKRIAVIDLKYALLVFFWKMIPGWLWVRLPIKNYK